MTPYHHACSSATKWGGDPADYMPVHLFLDSSKEHMADFRHRAIYHHSASLGLVPRLYGDTITNSQGRAVPVRLLVEQHVREDCGFIPSVNDWLQHLKPVSWMANVGTLDNSIEDYLNQPPPDDTAGDEAIWLLREILVRMDTAALAKCLGRDEDDRAELTKKLDRAANLVRERVALP